jgi:hypothetical protein
MYYEPAPCRCDIQIRLKEEKKEEKKHLPHAATNLVHRESLNQVQIEDREGDDFISR